jgi:hypothetical protein
VASPVPKKQLQPFPKGHHTLQFGEPLAEGDYRKVAALLEKQPGVELYVYDVLRQFKDLRFLRHFPKLKRLHLGCDRTEDVSYLKELPAGMTHLTIACPPGRKVSLGDLAHLRKLRTLKIDGEVSEPERIADFKGLRNLQLRQAPVKDLELLAELPGLERLHLSGGKLDLRPLVKIKRLESLTLGRLHTSTDFSVLSELKGLKFLRIYWQAQLKVMPDLSGLKGLAQFFAETLNGLVDLRGLAAAPNLKLVQLAGVPKASDVSRKALAKHPKMVYLHIYPKGPSFGEEEWHAALAREEGMWHE